MEKLEELNYHVDFGPYYVHLTRKQKKYLAVRSVIDRILAALALVLLSPLFLAVSIAQKVSAPDEPIFFLQKRVGKGAHCFNIIKVRTMKSSAPKNVATGDLENPQMYISKVGRFLRDTSIDELPQLANVVRGEMSLILNVPLEEFEEFKSHSLSVRTPSGRKMDLKQAPVRGLGTPNGGIVVFDKTSGEAMNIMPKSSAHVTLRCQDE